MIPNDMVDDMIPGGVIPEGYKVTTATMEAIYDDEPAEEKFYDFRTLETLEDALFVLNSCGLAMSDTTNPFYPEARDRGFLKGIEARD